MHLLQDKKIAIIGGGPGGLTLANLLQQKGADLKVYERDIDRSTRLQGGALDLHAESGLAALAKAGLMEAFKANYRPGAEKVRVVDHRAKIYADEHTADKASALGHKHFRPEIDRGPLRDILLDVLQPDTVVWDAQLLSLEPIGQQWKILFKNGQEIRADIVIGADGAQSKIRQQLTDLQPIWTGITMIEGVLNASEKTAPHIHQLLKGGKIFAYGNNKTLIVSSKGDGNFGFATGVRTDENWVRDCGIDFKDHSQVLAWFQQSFSEWDSVWHELFASEQTLYIPRPQYCMPLDLSWKAQDNITLIGDAAHWMPPFAGEGVNMAMLDALQLSDCLTNPKHRSLQRAFSQYEQEMFQRFAKVGQDTMFNTQWMHSPNALQQMLSMFGKNTLQQASFIGKMWLATSLIPFVRKSLGLKPKQHIDRIKN